MGKNSLIKSTDKKKDASPKKKKEVTNKTSSKAAPKKSKSASGKTKKKSAANSTKKSQKKKVSLSLKEILFKNFEWKYTEPRQKTAPSAKTPLVADAPPFVTAQDAEEVERIRKLLFNKYRMEEIKAAAKAPAAPITVKEPQPAGSPAQAVVAEPAKEPSAKPKKVALSLKEILFKNFEWEYTEPRQIAAPSDQASQVADAPPFVTAQDAEEVERIRKLLFNKYQMEEIKAAAKAPAAPITVKEPQPAGSPAQVVVAEPAKEPPAKQSSTEGTAKIQHLPPDPPADDFDPVRRAMMYMIAGTVVLVLLLVGASWKNNNRFYMVPEADVIEIWRGSFSPMGKRIVMTLSDFQITEPVQEAYSREEVYPVIFSYYMNKADALLEVSGLPDYESIKVYLNQAKQFAISPEMNTTVSTRLNNIERMTLLYKVDVAISQGTPQALQTAMELLKKAEPLAGDAVQAELIIRKKEKIAQQLAALEAQTTETQSETN